MWLLFCIDTTSLVHSHHSPFVIIWVPVLVFVSSSVNHPTIEMRWKQHWSWSSLLACIAAVIVHIIISIYDWMIIELRFILIYISPFVIILVPLVWCCVTMCLQCTLRTAQLVWRWALQFKNAILCNISSSMKHGFSPPIVVMYYFVWFWFGLNRQCTDLLMCELHPLCTMWQLQRTDPLILHLFTNIWFLLITSAYR